MASLIPDDCIPLIQKYLHFKDFIASRLVSRAFAQNHSHYHGRKRYNHKDPVPKYLVAIKAGEKVTDETLQGSPHLRLLHLEDWEETRGVSDDGIRGLRNLRSLECSYLITDEGIKDFPKLKCLSVNNLISDRGVSRLHGLKELYLPYDSIVTNTGIKNLKKLEVLAFSRGITDKGLKNLTRLEKLDCSRAITDIGIRNLTNLTFLRMAIGSKISNGGVKNLVNLKEIQFGKNINLTGLTHLKLESITYFGSDDFDANDLNKIPTLETLECEAITNSELLELPNLEHLLTRQTIFKGLSRLLNLNVLVIEKMIVCDDDLLPLVNLQTLKLSKQSENVTDVAISKMKQLRVLDLGKSSITGKGLKSLNKLRTLSLGQTELGNGDIENLNLKELHINSNTNITKDCKIFRTIQGRRK